LTPAGFAASKGQDKDTDMSIHSHSIAAYPIKTGGFRGVILNRATRERKASEVLSTLEAARFWAKTAAFEALAGTPFTFAAIRIKGEYQANVWIAE
jgi:hypothetical protein